ncbi:MAG: hypothetical protein M0P50_09160, partial [Bacteroidales bacterium]|nr:hypothetical protein [Bacteroidales bacterium]
SGASEESVPAKSLNFRSERRICFSEIAKFQERAKNLFQRNREISGRSGEPTVKRNVFNEQ